VSTHAGIPLDEVEDLLLDSAAYRQAGRILLPRQRDVRGRPLTPLHGGHVPDRTIQCILSHENVSTTQRFYIKTASAVAVDAMKKLEEKISGTAVVQ
jgi:hypothetical protein